MLKKAILEILETENQKVTPLFLENRIIRELRIERKHVRKVIKALLTEGELVYSYHFGNSYLEKSFNRPVRISDRVVLKPADSRFVAGEHDVVISLDHGASFGTGQHPTTRLAIRAIEVLAAEIPMFSKKNNTLVLDIGTGSGVLALTALKFGLFRALATDFDPCARDEAFKNAMLNALDGRFLIYNGDVADLETTVDLVCANLRFPTLMNLSGEIDRLCGPEGCAVFSGVREDEFNELLIHYGRLGIFCHWKSSDHGWSGGAFTRNFSFNSMP